MSTLIFPPETALKQSQSVSVVPVNFEREDPTLLEMLLQQGNYEEQIQPAALSWYRAGTGPNPTTGGVWVPGSTLVPIGTPTGIVTSILCNYSRQNWAGWQSQISLRLFITNAAQTLGWTAPLDVATGSTTVDTIGANIPANCRITLQIKVGNITGGLYQPPYISSYNCSVNT